MACVDKNAALQACGGRAPISADSLSALLDALENDRHQISAAIHDHDWPTAERLVHHLHGSCCYCSVPALKHCCHALESALKKPITNGLTEITAFFNLAVDALLLWRAHNSPQQFFDLETV